MNRDLDLSGVQLKLAHAQKHTDALRDDVGAFTDGDPPPFGVRAQETAGPGGTIDYVLYAQVRAPVPPKLALAVGDAVQNMRAALDHLVYALVPEALRSRRTLFPIIMKRDKWKKEGAPRIKGVDEESAALIERMQPYHGRGEGEFLAVLGALSIDDKHKLLVPVVAATDDTATWIVTENASITRSTFYPGPIEDGAPAFAFRASPKDPSKAMEVYPQSGLRLEIADIAVKNIDVVLLLETLHEVVAHSIVRLWTDPLYRRWRLAQL